MNTEEMDLELYKNYLNDVYGYITIGGDCGVDSHTFKASEIFEQMHPKAFQTGLREFLLNEVENARS